MSDVRNKSTIRRRHKRNVTFKKAPKAQGKAHKDEPLPL